MESSRLVVPAEMTQWNLHLWERCFRRGADKIRWLFLWSSVPKPAFVQIHPNKNAVPMASEGSNHLLREDRTPGI